MSRDWNSRGFAPQRTPPPGAYTELVDFFGGDPDRAAAWLAGQLAYAGDAATAEQLLAAAQQVGSAQTAINILRALPLSIAVDWGAALDVPYSVAQELQVWTTTPTGAIEVAADF